MSARTPEITVDQLSEGLQSPATLVDVREPSEYVGGHVPGSVLMPMGQLASRTGELDRSMPVYVICATGNRSLASTDFLTHNGFQAYSVFGGVRAWALSGRDVSTGRPSDVARKAHHV